VQRIIPWFAAAVLACGGDRVGGNASFRTTVDTIGDTIVARSTGTISDSLARTLVVEWRAGAGADDEANSFASIASIAVGRDDRVFVWDPRTPSIRMYDARGKLVRAIGRKGSGPGEYDRLNGLTTLPDGRMVAWDGGNARINVYTADGDPLTTWHPPVSTFGTSNALSSDTASRVWARAWVPETGPKWGALGRTAWFVIDSSGAIVDTVRQPEADLGDPPVIARQEGGSSSMNVPYALAQVQAASPLGFLVWGPTQPYRVYAEWSGRPLRIERQSAPVAVSDEERAQQRAVVEWSMRQTEPGWTWQGRDVPATKPAYASLSVGLDGRIWVAAHTESERYTPEPPLRPQQNPRPQITFRPARRVRDVFEPDGRYLGRVLVPRNVTILATRGDIVWGSMTDENDVPSLVRMRVQPGFDYP
jgi:hypothetical protein